MASPAHQSLLPAAPPMGHTVQQPHRRKATALAMAQQRSSRRTGRTVQQLRQQRLAGTVRQLLSQAVPIPAPARRAGTAQRSRGTGRLQVLQQVATGNSSSSSSRRRALCRPRLLCLLAVLQGMVPQAAMPAALATVSQLGMGATGSSSSRRPLNRCTSPSGLLHLHRYGGSLVRNHALKLHSLT